MPIKKAKKHKLEVNVKHKKIRPHDLLPESREFLERAEAPFIKGGLGELKEEKSPLIPPYKGARNEVEEEKYKKMIMWSGVTFFMLLISFLWIFNMKQVFKETAVKASDNSSQKDWNDISKELSNVMSQMKTGIDEIKEVKNISGGGQTEVSAKNTLPASNAAGQLPDKDKIEELKSKLENTKKK